MGHNNIIIVIREGIAWLFITIVAIVELSWEHLNNNSIESERLGFHKLNDEERQDMITYNYNGDLQIKSICEDCQESLERNPEYYQNDFLIH